MINLNKYIKKLYREVRIVENCLRFVSIEQSIKQDL